MHEPSKLSTDVKATVVKKHRQFPFHYNSWHTCSTTINHAPTESSNIHVCFSYTAIVSSARDSNATEILNLEVCLLSIIHVYMYVHARIWIVKREEQLAIHAQHIPCLCGPDALRRPVWQGEPASWQLPSPHPKLNSIHYAHARVQCQSVRPKGGNMSLFLGC